MKSKLEESDIETIQDALQEVEDWLLQNRKATTVEIDEMANNHIILK